MILGSKTPFNLLQTYKNQQAMLAGKSTHNQQCEEKFMFWGRNFSPLKLEIKYD
jgi:hypothetical protein